MHNTYQFLASAIHLTFSIILGISVSYYQPQPYMDEIFHINQTISYIHGNWTAWNNKITTPPGLYLIFVIFYKLINIFQSVSATNILLFRISSAIFSFINHYLILKICTLKSIKNPVLVSFMLISQPVLFFFSGLYYTDQCSLTFVLMAVYYSIFGKKFKSAFFILFGTFTRQSNIIWVPFLMAIIVSEDIFRKLFKTRKKYNSKEWMYQLFIKLTTPPYLIYNIALTSVLNLCMPLLSVGLMFLVFVWMNGGIVLGDRNAHQASVNIPQLWYFLLFCTFFTWSEFLNFIFYQIVTFRNSLTNTKRHAWVKPSLLILILFIFIFISLRYFSVVHPYLLADNRHYTFYIWRLLNKSLLIYYGLTLMHICTTLYYFNQLFDSTCPISFNEFVERLILFICIPILLITSSLFELRYFLTPYTLWYLFSNNKASKTSLRLQLCWNFVINLISIYMFIAKPFTWVSEPGVYQRFMW